MSAEAGIHADFHTSAGDFSILLHHQASPRTVANFIGLAEGTRAWIHPGTGAVVSGKPFYNGLVFHRVIAGFMNQGGCPLGNGSSGPGYTFRDEFSPGMTHGEPYRISMANSGMNTNGSQFFITVAATPWLDGLHTVFGTVDAGSGVLDQINAVATDSGNKPLAPVVIHSVEIRREGPDAETFEIDAQGLPVCRGSAGRLEVNPGVAALWRLEQALPGGSILRGYRSTDLATWSFLGERYQAPGGADFTTLTLDAAASQRAFYHLSTTEYPDALGTSAMSGRSLVASFPAGELFTFWFDSTGMSGTGNYLVAGGSTPFTFTVYQAAHAPYSSSWIFHTSSYGYLRFRCGLDSRVPGSVLGRQTGEWWNGAGWVSLGAGALNIDG